jgi:hypothetical protein
VAAGEFALATILDESKVGEFLQATRAEIEEFLRDDCRYFGGCP